jgi:integrase
LESHAPSARAKLRPALPPSSPRSHPSVLWAIVSSHLLRIRLPAQGCLGPRAGTATALRPQPKKFLDMPGKQAKVVTPQMLRRMLRRSSKAPFPARHRVMILLSVKAGLRACEIARLEWSMVLDARGKVADILAIHDAIAKKRGGRRIPAS